MGLSLSRPVANLRDLTTPSTQQAIAEAAAWCALQGVTTDGKESEDFRRRRQLVADAGILLNKARSTTKSPWSSETYDRISKSSEWLKALELLREADTSTLTSLDWQFRSAALAPNPSLQGIYSEPEWQVGVATLVAKRSNLLREHGVECGPVNEPDSGRLLCYRPAENLSCGAATFSSNGFFTFDNCPPWDLWVSFADGELIAYVPHPLIALVQEGIDANPEQCIDWVG